MSNLPTNVNLSYSKITEFYSNFLQYRPVLRKYFGKVTTVILLNQIERWFAHKPIIFYKFLAPCQHNLYREGDSWEEELGFSVSEFRSAFDEIGIRYASKNEVLERIEVGNDPFQGKYYLSYKDVRQGLTYYLRNDLAINTLFNQMIRESKATSLKFDFEDAEKRGIQEQSINEQLKYLKATITSKEKSQFPEMKKSISGNEHSGDQESLAPDMRNIEIRSKECSLPYNEQENTAIITQEITTAEIASAKTTDNAIPKKFAAAFFSKNNLIENAKLNEQQIALVNQFITTHFQRIKHLGNIDALKQALIFDLESPQSFTHAGNDFHKKFNTLKKAVINYKWSPREWSQEIQSKLNEKSVKLKQKIKELELGRQSFINALQEDLGSSPVFQKSCHAKIKKYDELLAPLYQQLKQLRTDFSTHSNVSTKGDL